MVIIDCSLNILEGPGTRMISFELSPEQRQLRELAEQVAHEIYGPKAAQWDADRTVLPPEEVRRLAGLGFLGITLPEEYGGSGGSLIDALIVIEELAKACRPAAFQVFEANGATRHASTIHINQNHHKSLDRQERSS
jgi:butyryl-CoA dehydrogenase